MSEGATTRGLSVVAAAGIAGGGAAWLSGRAALASALWAATTVVVLVPLAWGVVRSLLRARPGVDAIALVAMAAALAVGEHLAGAVVALMLSGGQALEELASRRAARDLTALLERAPRVVHRYEDGQLTTPDLGDIRPGDRLLVKAGEIVPVDGVLDSPAVLDESAWTGEPLPVERREGERVPSGVVNAGAPFDLRAVALASESTYAGIVRLVREARESRAPLVRLADRYALWFLPLTLAAAGAAWALSGEPVRAVAVLVVATPCPLILAAPIAILSGVSRCSRRGILVKSGGAIEALARADVLLLDKTGTLTAGRAVLSDVRPLGDRDEDELLRLAASLDQVSPHVLAAALVRAARERGLRLSFPSAVREEPGEGIAGRVDGCLVALGRCEWVSGGAAVPPEAHRIRRRSAFEGSTAIFASVDGVLAGALVLHDPIRPDTPRTIRALRKAGIRRVIMVTGDHPDVAETVGLAIGADLVLAERSPSDKLDVVRAESTSGTTIMVGDGINDAPALAAADIGVALGAHGAGASSQAADVVLTVDRLDRLVEALRIARRSRAIALQSIAVGMGLSVAAMALAAAGGITPVAGAALQEAIDVAVIVNALRALRGDRGRPGVAAEAAERSRDEHRRLLPEVDRLRTAAERLDSAAAGDALRELREVRRFLEERLLPHERAEDAAVYPVVARLIGGDDPTSTMSRAHLEIQHLARLFGRLLDELPPEGPGADDRHDLRRVLYGLHAVLRLHFAQEEEHYFTLLDDRSPAGPAAGIGR